VPQTLILGKVSNRRKITENRLSTDVKIGTDLRRGIELIQEATAVVLFKDACPLILAPKTMIRVSY